MKQQQWDQTLCGLSMNQVLGLFYSCFGNDSGVLCLLTSHTNDLDVYNGYSQALFPINQHGLLNVEDQVSDGDHLRLMLSVRIKLAIWGLMTPSRITIH